MTARRWLTGLGLMAALVSLPAAARAGTIVVANDTSFSGTYSLTGSTATTDIYSFVVSATFGASASSDYTYIASLAFQMGGLTDANYTVTPTVVGPGPDTWSVEAGGISNGSGSASCDMSGTAFWCANPSGFGAKVGASGTTDQWTFTLTVPTADALTGNQIGDLKAGFTDASGNKVGSILSEGVTFTPCTGTCGGGGSVPEPASMVLLATGLGAIVARRRRQRG